MAFTWEVEALRKLIEGIVEEVEIKQAGEELAQEHIDAYKKKPEASKLWDVYKEEWVANPDARVDPNDPFGLNDPDPVEGISYEEFYESLRGEEKHKQNMRYLRGLGKTKRGKDKLKLEWVDKILKEFQEEKAPEVINLGEGKSDWDDMERYLRGIKGPTIFDPEIEPRDIDRGEMGYLRGESTEEFNARMQKEQEEAWARGEVEEEFDDWLKRTQEMEKMSDMSPFLSYLLRQSPYARLPAAGLLGLGLMGYSKPAY